MGIPAAVIRKAFYDLGFFAKTLKGVVVFIRNSKASFKILVMQILFTFVHALGISTLLALAIGAAVNCKGIRTALNSVHSYCPFRYGDCYGNCRYGNFSRS